MTPSPLARETLRPRSALELATTTPHSSLATTTPRSSRAATTPRSSLAAAWQRLGELLSSRDRDVRGLVGLGLMLIASGWLHVGVWSAAGWPSLTGPVSWRKPIVFGFSGGVAMLSVAWLASLLAPSPARTRWSRVYLATMALEVSLIDLQRWRGVGSHFNVATPLDGGIFALMGVLIVTAMVAATALGVRVVRSPAVAVDTRLAAGAGVALLVAGSVVGGVMSSLGGLRGATSGGALKLPHAVALHGLQVLPVLAWWLAHRGLALPTRVRILAGAAAAHALVFVAALGLAIGLGR